MDFLALMVISDFDNFFYAEHSSSSEISKKIVGMKDDLYAEMFKIQTSTSRDAQPYPKKEAKQFKAIKKDKGTSKELTPEERETAANIYNKHANEINKFIPLKATAWISSVTDWANDY